MKYKTTIFQIDYHKYYKDVRHYSNYDLSNFIRNRFFIFPNEKCNIYKFYINYIFSDDRVYIPRSTDIFYYTRFFKVNDKVYENHIAELMI